MHDKEDYTVVYKSNLVEPFVVALKMNYNAWRIINEIQLIYQDFGEDPNGKLGDHRFVLTLIDQTDKNLRTLGYYLGFDDEIIDYIVKIFKENLVQYSDEIIIKEISGFVNADNKALKEFIKDLDEEH